ncbi:MAG: KUP/HAK/KT family potassium transporter [Alphaproteobacteria bacterium]|nr:KUP/HAK/KT family potassium transporter [Alphaproteobacteria bacterium]
METNHQKDTTNNALKKITIAGLLITTGIVFGDLGTSPLYVFKSFLTGKVISEELIFGGVSCIFWTLTLQTTFKYVLITLQADNRGEGGIFSLYALIRRYRKWLFLPTIIGAATLLADGIITPPISVTSAIEGLHKIELLENIFSEGSNAVVYTVLIIISLLFFFQRFGTKIVGMSFGPFMIIWFGMIFILGLLHMVQNIHIIKALNPYYAMRLLTHYPQGFWLLGAIFLCTTGAEALYSDLGHCGRLNIRISWIFVKIALVVNYLGQGAFLLNFIGHDFTNKNPFFDLMPEWFLFAGIFISTFATIIASQALISGAFTLISESVSLNFWPRVTLKYPSDLKGQSYIPSLNFFMWIGCSTVVLTYRTSTAMEGAYGFAICTTMLMTTILVFYYLTFIKKWHRLITIPILLFYLTIEISFFIANSPKLLYAHIIIFYSVTLFLIMFIWYKSKKITTRFLEFVELDKYLKPITELSFDKDIPRFANHLIYLTKAPGNTLIEKRIIDSILNFKPKRANIYWFVHIERTDNPFEMCYKIEELVNDKIVKINFRLGFKVQPHINILVKNAMQDMKSKNELGFQSKYESLDKESFHADITYVIMETYFSIENDLKFWEDLLMDTYFNIKKFAQKDTKAFGVDAPSIVVERVPLIIMAKKFINIKRIE